ncbi:transglycosylase domain-containing protein [Mesobacillus harenae]|uniref:transglycosylase domain-containing protein n=1 Tax=Mesobacillus harenae TaxID=2213203 RepID=UPI00158052CA|nr:transglycosylase domain-containing protein [Mesobacillus harenae]
MNQNKRNAWKDRLKSWSALFTNKRTVKGARVTYSVVWNLLLLFVIITVLGAAFAGGVGAGYFASLVKEEPIRTYESMQKDIYNYEATSEVYFSDEVYLGKLRTDLYREEVKLEDVSEHVINALIATEDEYFYQHDGVVPKAIMRAVLQEVTNSATQTGGSTLTQQLIKNQILTNEISFERKAKEILLALRLEKFFDKKEILEAYLNVSTFGRNSAGRNIAGVETAANGIFGVDAKDLTLPQAAYIAGLPQSPFGYTPFTQTGERKTEEGLRPGLDRMKTVLNRMYTGGFIEEHEYKEALAYDITKDFTEKNNDDTFEEYPYLTVEIEKRSVDILAKILAKNDGYEEDDLATDENLRAEYLTLANRNLRQNGYKIHTTINKKIYDIFQKVEDEYKDYGRDKPQKYIDPETGEEKTKMEQVEAGAILIENKTGKIISFLGGRDFDKEQVNHATGAPRPNGSTMKPLLVYAPAMELGRLSPGTVLPDVEARLKPGSNDVWPHNYSRNYTGLTSVRNALEKSHNVPAVIAYKNILDQTPAQYLEKMGFSTLLSPDYTNRSTSIGSLEKGVTVEENVNAFGTFANDGKFVDAYMIDKIVDKDGNVVFEHKSEPVEVFSPQTAYLSIDMMRDVINSGTASSLRNRLKFGSDWAGKTGTGHNFQDVWFVATNPNVSFGTWMGYDTPKPLDDGNSTRNINLWAALMNAAYDVAPELVDPEERFKMPGGIVKRSYCAVSGLLPSKACNEAGLVRTDLFNAKHVPTKVDDSLVESKFVWVGEKRYLALDSTPSEFAESGVILNPEYMESLLGHKIRNPEQLLPKSESWAKILVADSKLEENGKKPAVLNIKESKGTITWSAHSEKDIVGYRVYNGDKKVASIKGDAALTYKAGDGSFYVTAVDIAGKESAPSNIIELGQKPVAEKPKEEKPKEKPKPEKEDKPADGEPAEPPADPPAEPSEPPAPPTDEGGGSEDDDDGQ